MAKELWNRRQLMQTCLQAAAAAALAGTTRTAAGQFPPPEPLRDDRFTLVTTTETSPWQHASVFKPAFSYETLNLNIEPGHAESDDKTDHRIEGFGGCFNELGWTSLQSLSEADRDGVLHELFDPHAGARFTYCRMPVGANDFSVDAYSYDETDGDFEQKHFSIDHDRKTLIPFIHAAQRYQPRLRLWASPWTPPSWMKRNHFYAEAAARQGWKDNGIRPDQVGHEGEDMFILEPRYLEAYAKYFGRFIEAYRAEAINVGMVMPQNEFNSAQNFPSCTWTPEGLIRFLHYLGPEMQKHEVQVFFGPLERGDPKLLETVMADQEAARFLKGVGVQWAGKNSLPRIHQEFPSLLVYQSEQECGDGSNSWAYTSYCWQLMKHYFWSGASAYMYWNISLDQGSVSTWGWTQNSLVSVDARAKTFHYNHDYYLLKHLTHFVDVGARRIATSGTCDDALAFQNPNGSTVVLVRNESPHTQRVQLQFGGDTVLIQLPADSIATVVAQTTQRA
jgi:glucosylceramidase